MGRIGGWALASWLVVAGCDETGQLVVGGPVDDDTELAVDTDPGRSPLDSDPSDPPSFEPCAPDDGATGDLTADGLLRVTRSEGRTEAGGCDMRWVRFLPSGTPSRTLVVLAHGQQRSPDQVAGWAEHLAAWGYEVLAPELCHASLGDTDHARNGAELAALAEALAPGRPVLYAGHTTGGVAAMLAAAADPQAVGVLGLDLADVDGLALKAAPTLTVPARGLLGDPNLCNGNGNARGVFRAPPDGGFLLVRDGNPCDFESPTDVWCANTCGIGSGYGEVPDARQRRAIRGLALAFAKWTSGDDLDGLAWWTRGCPPLDELVATGVIR